MTSARAVDPGEPGLTLASIGAIGTFTPPRTVSADELARAHDTTPALIEASTDGRTVRAWDGSSFELGLQAVRACLARVGPLDPAEIGLVIWCGAGPRADNNAEHLQAELGFRQASTLELTEDCTDSIAALWMARAALREDATLGRALIVCADQYHRGDPRRAIARVQQDAPQIIFSDGAAAALVERSTVSVLQGFGAATTGAFWDYHVRVAAVDAGAPDEALPSATQLLYDSIPVFRLAVARALRSSGVTMDQIEHVICNRERLAVRERIVRYMGLSSERLDVFADLPTHMGASDALVGLAELRAARTLRPGAHVLVATRTAGAMWVAVVRT